jgi:pimeloyl-ACP methyl ester carboxylesterase
VLGAVLVGSSPELPDPPPWRNDVVETFLEPCPDDPQGFEKFNLAYWRDHWEGFAAFWFDLSFPEPHSTKAKEDAVRWATETGPDVLLADISSMQVALDWEALLGDVACPLLFVHGTNDRIAPYEAAERAAGISGAGFVSLEGAGHIPLARDPVRFNLILRDFIEGLAA